MVTLPLQSSRSIAPRFAVAGDCEAGAHRLWAGRRGGRRRQYWRRATANVGDRPSPMLATVATAPIDCGISQSVADVGDPPSPTLATGGRRRQRRRIAVLYSSRSIAAT
ncbi:hypothetical protein Y032_0039g161 [Ancylostoma ceylanicum]|uniref:Uncharacterized protein n=1 Tax=Ancylostoma ceylanicum TaxID=53326 RepID=A0A016UHY9_9BILA|nr:hypothetical protein Y032_0039g161 [Ancylostoma ceylanicum]